MDGSEGVCCSIECDAFECEENWQCPSWDTIPCTKTGIRSRTCVDLNDCEIQGRKTYFNVPQLTQECAYVSTCENDIKNDLESDIDCGGICGSTCIKGQKCNDNIDCMSNQCINEVCFCEEDWECTEWVECPPHEVQLRSCSDKNKCGTTYDRPEVTKECEYIAPLTEDKKEVLEETKQASKDLEESIDYEEVDEGKKDVEILTLEKDDKKTIILVLLVLIFIILVIFLKRRSKPSVFLSLAFTILVMITLIALINIRFGVRNLISLLMIIPLLYILTLSFVYYAHKKKKMFIIVFLNSYPVLKKLFFTEIYVLPDVNQLRDYISGSLRKDRSLSAIKNKLNSTGWPKYLVNKAFQHISVIEGKKSRLSDIIVSIMRISTKEENMIINSLLEKEGLTERRLINRLDFSKEKLASVLSSLRNRKIIEIRRNKIYFNKSLKS